MNLSEMTNNDMTDLLRVTDHAAQQSDRWLFLACLGVMFAGMFLFWRWIVADREKLANRLTAITDRHIQTAEKLAEVVTNNTTALNEFRKTAERCSTRNG